MPEYSIAQVGPAESFPCGILDYIQILQQEFSKTVNARYFSYEDAQNVTDWDMFNAVYVHYERSLLPKSFSLKTLGKILGEKGYLIPHEIYDEDPFAYPYHMVTSKWPLVHGMKRWLYRRSHRGFFEEKKIQSQNYFFLKVIALSESNRAVLRKQGAIPLQKIIPLAMPPPAGLTESVSPPEIFQQEKKSSAIWLGVFGFINPANNYQMLMDLLKSLPENYRLILIGGDKGNSALLKEIFSLAEDSGVKGKLFYTGYIPAKDVPRYLRECHVFICPFKHKSNSSSVLHLFQYQKPVLGTNIPVLQELKSRGAPIDLFGDLSELLQKISLHPEEKKPLENNYPFSARRVCEEYLKIAGLNVNGYSE